MYRLLMVLSFTLVTASTAVPQTSKFGFQPLTNEVSIYQNYSDDGGNSGQTLQVIAINSFKILTDFMIEFTADFNRKLTSGYDSDYYIEIGIVKPVFKRISLNVQRIYGTFVCREINQVGFRFSF